MTAEFQVIDLEIPAELAGKRLDSALACLLPQHSRTRIKGWIEGGAVLVGRRRLRPRDIVTAGSQVRVQIAWDRPELKVLPETIALRLVHEDGDLLVVDKPAGLVVHPGAGNPRHTLQNALLGLDPKLAALAARRAHSPARQGHQRPVGGGAQCGGADLIVAAADGAHHVAGVSGGQCRA